MRFPTPVERKNPPLFLFFKVDLFLSLFFGKEVHLQALFLPSENPVLLVFAPSGGVPSSSLTKVVGCRQGGWDAAATRDSPIFWLHFYVANQRVAMWEMMGFGRRDLGNPFSPGITTGKKGMFLHKYFLQRFGTFL